MHPMAFVIYPEAVDIGLETLSSPQKYWQRARVTIGGKASALVALAKTDILIPKWFVVSAAAFERSITDTQQHILESGNIADIVANVLPHLCLHDAIQAELQLALNQLCPNGELVAVRSSSLEEDGLQQSFAGQLDSFLMVPPEQVVDRVVDVWRSGFSDRLLTYRQEHNLPLLPKPPAVLIQHMVEAHVSGVAFSANPVTGQRRVAVIAAVPGLGSALVSGELNATTYHVTRTNQITPPLSPTPLLTDSQITTIATLARQVESYFHRPQDIEWAIADDRLYLLQARPITALASMPDPDSKVTVWDNSNIAESYGGITTPLTFSFARNAYEAVYRQFCKIMGVPESAIAQHGTVFRSMLGLVQGRIYYNLLNWYRVLALLPGFTINRRFMEQMMGVQEELPVDVLASLNSASAGDKLRDALHLIGTVVGLVKNYVTLPQQIRHFYQRLDRALCLPQAELETLQLDELAAYYYDLERQLLTRWDAPLINDFFAMIFYGVLRKLTAAWCGDTAGTLQNNLISGEGGVISVEPAQQVQQMADCIRGDRGFVDILCAGSLQQIQAKMSAYPDFQRQYQAYLQKFGDRCLEELKLESPTLHDDPLPLLRAVGSLARSQSQPSSEFKIQNSKFKVQAIHNAECHTFVETSQWDVSTQHPRIEAEARVKRALKHRPLRQLLFNWVLANARARVRDRENLRFERTRVFGRVRRIVVEMGRRLYAGDRLQDPHDIFYLNLEEILGFIDGTTTSTDLNGLATLRKAEFGHYCTLPAPPDRFQTPLPIHLFTQRDLGFLKEGTGLNADQIQNSKFKIQSTTSRTTAIDDTSTTNVLQGTGCCPGIVRAPVQVITDPRSAVVKHGSILVAERTDPGWIMLFPAAAGVLVERGSLLSHAAIVAREMGIPAIVALPGVTQWLTDGDWVEMNGSTGTVQRIANPSEDAFNGQ
jgi:rifampicin phosphotransferase